MAGKKYSEIITSPHAGDLITGRMPSPSMTPLSLLPQSSWWKLFIDRRYHTEAGPALLFHRQASKGFYSVMMRVFKAELGLKDALHKMLDWGEYEALYEAVSRDVRGIAHRGRSGINSPVGTTNFPPIYTPSGAALAELLTENVGYWNIPGNIKNMRPTDKVQLIFMGFPPTWRFSVAYTMEEAPGLANAFFTRYYQEIGAAAGGALAQLTAIVRLVRALHVYHFFRDANGRLNTMVVLNKLLLENGFPPAIVSDPAIFGGGRTIAELIDDVHNGMKIVLREMEAHARFSGLDLAT